MSGHIIKETIANYKENTKAGLGTCLASAKSDAAAQVTALGGNP